ncbi:hypothetical protein CJ030_MR0G004314 [Morella rubra]|uniref:RNase H type-1 domain-containing protein n=1 Tax=Morella rubra TaxID=262757 RepID=A0A6A1UM21_9ROSI|nr:hypothetical protein CJ030_MR0G004286 [Morella rubra]KAB1201339.1 hypothetical protein CJ030_MR0G004314 [Morella rubra]
MVVGVRKLQLEHQEAWNSLPKPPQVKWLPPSGNFWKLNYDVAIRPSQTVIAVVCRKAVAEILFVRTKSLPPRTPLVGEAKAALFAAQEAHFLSHEFVVFEGDNLAVAQAINQPESPVEWSIRPVISDVLMLLELHSQRSFSPCDPKGKCCSS